MSIKNVIPDWSQLRLIGNAWPSKLSILVPFLGAFILFNGAVIQYFEAYANSSSMSIFAKELSVKSGSVVLLYYGLFLFGLGSSIYQLGAHRIIKTFQSPEEYALFYKGVITSADLQRIIGELEASASFNELQKSQIGLHSAKLQMDSGQITEELYSSTAIVILKAFYTSASTRWVFMRGVSALLFGLGITLAILPSLSTFFYITIMLFLEGV